VLYGQLSQKHPDLNEALHCELDDFYVGGYQAARNAKRYIPRLANEHPTRWEERVQSAAFISYLGQIVDFFTSSLFKQPLAVVAESGEVDEKFYDAFSDDVDLSGAALSEFLRGVISGALVHKRALVGCDFPRGASAPSSRAEEDLTGASRAYLLPIDLLQMIDWEHDDSVRIREKVLGGSVEFELNRFKWCVLRRKRYPRASVLDARGKCVEEFKVWQRTEDGQVGWALFRIEYDHNRPPNEKIEVPLVDSDVTSFTSIPIVELCIPDGLWIGNKVGPLNKEHWQRRTAINSSENRGLISIPWVKLGSEIGEAHGVLPAEVQQDPNRGLTLHEQLSDKGYMVLGGEDDIGFAQPDGAMQVSAEERVSKLVDEIFRISHLMAASISSTATQVGRSGASKAEDRHSTTVVLHALGAIVRDFARRIYDQIANGRGERAIWRAHGLDKFDLYDREEIVDEATQVETVAIPSETFKRVYKTELATRLVPNVDPTTAATIEDEIKAGVAEEEKRKAEAKKLEQKQPENDTNASSQQPQRPGDQRGGGDASGRKRPGSRPV
jgi:hypothetical protein